MKKVLLITLLICMIGILSACGQRTAGGETESMPTISSGEKEESRKPQESESIGDIEKNNKTAEIISLQKQYFSDYRWMDDKLVVISEYNNLILQDEKEQYPQMKRILSEIAGMQKRSWGEEADNIYSFACEMGMLDANAENFETQVSTLDVQVRRADSVVISFLSDSYADYGFIEDFRGMWGSNYDTQTGQELVLTDVIKDMDQIPILVKKELNSHIWAGEFYSETAIMDYFQNTAETDISWTLDYNGVTFYFGDGDLTNPGNGRQIATISFAEYPDLFEEKYRNVPEAYMVRLPLDAPYFTDLDDDGTLEELNCTGFYNEIDRFYTEFGIYTDLDGYYHYEELFANDFQPYYVKTENGNHYIYLFCEECEGENPHMMLVVYNINDGILTKVGDMNIGPAYIPTDIFELPLNPNHMLLDDFDSLEQDSGVYMVGENGMPVRK